MTQFRLAVILVLVVVLGYQAFRDFNVKKSSVVYALKDIPEEAVISSSDIEERNLEKSKIPEDAITSSTIAVGRRARHGISAGELVSQHDVSSLASLSESRPFLQHGQRAISFCANTQYSVAGFVGPGDYIDILDRVGSGANIKAHTILSDVLVLDVGQDHRRRVGPESGDSAIPFTVELDPTKALKLTKAATVGKLYLTLRRK